MMSEEKGAGNGGEVLLILFSSRKSSREVAAEIHTDVEDGRNVARGVHAEMSSRGYELPSLTRARGGSRSARSRNQ